MILEDFCDLIFPHNESSNLPAFSETCILYDDDLKFSLFLEINSMINSLPELTSADDINDILKTLKHKNSPLIDSFLKHLIELYFTSPKVIASLKNGQTVLFPNAKELPEIDFELLETVIENVGEVANV